MGNSNFNLRVIRKFHTGQYTGAYIPPVGEATVIYDQWVHVYAAPEPETTGVDERYAFCIAIAIAFEADYDFVPVWEKDRRFNADDWPRDGYTAEYNAEAISDIRRNWNAPEGEGED